MKSRSVLSGVVLVLMAFVACTDANLYHRLRPPIEPDRLAFEGRVCSEDPVSSRFPVKLVVVADYAAGPLFATFDPGSLRNAVLNAFVQSALSSPEYELAIVGYAGRARKLAPTEGNFTRNPGELLNAINQLTLPQPCIGFEQCRDYLDGLRSARALIEGDMAALPAGERILTQYVVIMVTAGPHQPLAVTADCCPTGDTECIIDGLQPDQGCQAQREVQDVTELRESVAEQGGAGLRLHVLHLAAEPAADINDEVGNGLQQMAFAGAGLYQRFNTPNTFGLTELDVLNLRTVLRAKHFIVANLNAKATSAGPVPDSDADGLSDEEETRTGTAPDLRDSDGDGITDLVEVLVAFDPVGVDTPLACEGLRVGADLDRDFLTDCDEALLGTDPSLVDSDGDSMPDRLELNVAIDYLHRDSEADSDSDGIPNGDEVRDHTDPRSSDAAFHLTHGYRYTMDDEGIVKEPTASKLKTMTGIEVVGISAGTTAGVGTLRYFGGEAPTMTWQDASDAQPGPAIPVSQGGDVEMPSSSYAPVQGDEGRIITVRVDRQDLPPRDVVETVRIVFKERQCLNYTVRNVRMMDTIPVEGATEGGWNNVLLYFAQAPDDRLDIPGPFRMALVPVQYIPPDFRQPNDAILTVFDEEFVRPKLVVADDTSPPTP